MGVSLIIQKEGQTFPFAFDLGQYYQMRLNGDTEEMVLSQIADECVKQNQKEQDLLDFEKIKNRLWMQLLAKESNQERLKSCPYKEIEGTDLVATFHLHTNNEKDSTEGILVVNGLLEQWVTCRINNANCSMLHSPLSVSQFIFWSFPTCSFRLLFWIQPIFPPL